MLLALATLVLPACDSPGEDIAAARQGATVDLFRTDEAVATFIHTDPTGCIQTGVAVTASVISEGPTPAPGVQEAELNLTIGQSDVCQHMTLLDGSGDISDATFEIAPDLSSAHVTGTVVVFDVVSVSGIEFTIDVTWTGIGPIHPVGGAGKTKLPGSLVVDRFNARERDAIATGTVSDGTTNYAEQGSVFAEIDEAVGGTVEVSFAH